MNPNHHYAPVINGVVEMGGVSYKDKGAWAVISYERIVQSFPWEQGSQSSYEDACDEAAKLWSQLVDEDETISRTDAYNLPTLEYFEFMIKRQSIWLRKAFRSTNAEDQAFAKKLTAEIAHYTKAVEALRAL